MKAVRVLMVEWLGRGGFAHTAESWWRVAEEAGASPTLVTRAGRELAASVPSAVPITAPGGAVATHAAMALRVRSLLRSGEYQLLVLHGSVAPQLELPLLRVARRAGAKTVLVAHEPALARPSPGSSSAFTRLVQRADVVVAHSSHVAGELGRTRGPRNLVLLPLPLPLGLVSDDCSPLGAGHSAIAELEPPVALHYGHLHRAYKGTATVAALASRGTPGWRFAVVGKGAPASLTGAHCVDRFLTPEDLTATVTGSAASLLPYDRASQSGAVVLSQALGSVVVASAVGGIAEQVEDEVTGILLEPGSPPERWREVLISISSPQRREEIAAAARAAVAGAHAEFVRGVEALLGSSET